MPKSLESIYPLPREVNSRSEQPLNASGQTTATRTPVERRPYHDSLTSLERFANLPANRPRLRVRTAWTLAVTILIALNMAAASLAETAWVKEEVRLNLRTQAGTQYRILGVLSTGDKVEVVSRQEDWTQLKIDRNGSTQMGWIPAGYLQTEPPAVIRIVTLDAENITLKEQLEAATQELTQLREAHTGLSTESNTRNAELERLTMDNMRLRAGARYPEWVTGAGILAIGMLAGAILRMLSGRRTASRIRL